MIDGPRHIVLLRHGETFESSQGLFSGRGDAKLSPLGEEQARRWSSVFAPLLDSIGVYSSPMSRAQDTARLAGLQGATVLPSLSEWDLGSLDGQNSENVRAAHAGWSLFLNGAPGGESPSDVSERCDEVLSVILGSERPMAVVVAHGQLLRALTVRALGLHISDGRHLSFGPARVAILIRRASGNLSLAGWNVPPSSYFLDQLT